MSTGAVIMPVSQLSGGPAGEVTFQYRATAAGSSSTKKCHPWLKPADGARSPASMSWSSTSRRTGVELS